MLALHARSKKRNSVIKTATQQSTYLKLHRSFTIIAPDKGLECPKTFKIIGERWFLMIVVIAAIQSFSLIFRCSICSLLAFVSFIHL